MEITKDIKIMRIEVNGSVIGLDGITDINEPDGQVTIDFKRTRRIKNELH